MNDTHDHGFEEGQSPGWQKSRMCVHVRDEVFTFQDLAGQDNYIPRPDYRHTNVARSGFLYPTYSRPHSSLVRATFDGSAFGMGGPLKSMAFLVLFLGMNVNAQVNTPASKSTPTTNSRAF